MKTLITVLIMGFSGLAFGQQLTYTPINPAFGGNTFNYQWLLSSANAQNNFTESRLRGDENSLSDFTENLNRQILGQLSRSFFTSQLGEGLEAGTYNFGTLALEIFDSTEGLVINILDTATGEQTQIIVPN